ncbi:MAG: hypothetical protein WC450_10050 [Candidatus Omnitrophota bacterium]|jgi:hypothetical protein
MTIKGFLNVSCACLLLSGCSVIPGRARIDNRQPRAQAVPRTVVISGERLKKGGKVFVKPFIPGEHVAFDNAFDRMSLHVLKGFLTALQEAPELYTLLGADKAEQADLVVEGRILEIKVRRVFEKIWKRKSVYILKVEGAVLDRDSHKTVMYFTHELRRDDVDGFNALAEDAGKDIGRSVLILSQ